MPYDNTSRGYPLPHPDNIAVQDVERIRNALICTDKDICDLEDYYRSIDAHFRTKQFETFINLWS